MQKKKMGFTETAAANRLYDRLMSEKRAAKASAKPTKATLFKSGKTPAMKAAGLTLRFSKLAKTKKATKRGLFNSQKGR